MADAKKVAAAKDAAPNRRKFLAGAGAAGAGALAFPMIAKSQGVTTFRFQST